MRDSLFRHRAFSDISDISDVFDVSTVPDVHDDNAGPPCRFAPLDDAPIGAAARHCDELLRRFRGLPKPTLPPRLPLPDVQLLAHGRGPLRLLDCLKRGPTAVQLVWNLNAPDAARQGARFAAVQRAMQDTRTPGRLLTLTAETPHNGTEELEAWRRAAGGHAQHWTVALCAVADIDWLSRILCRQPLDSASPCRQAFVLDARARIVTRTANDPATNDVLDALLHA